MLDKFHKKIGFLKYLSPFYMFSIVEKLTNEANNYIFYRKNLSKLDIDGILRNYKINLNKDKMYFVVNLRPEVLLMSSNEILKHEQLVVSNEILKVENILSKYELYDLLKFTYDRILDNTYYAYAVTCQFNVRFWKTSNIVYVSSYIILSILSILYLFLK